MDDFWEKVRGQLVPAAILIGIVIILLLVFIPDGQTAALGGTSWTLATYGPDGAPVPAEAPATIAFEFNGRMTGSTGCNYFYGNYSANFGRLRFDADELAFTAMGCDPAAPSGAQDAFFRENLPGGASYTQLSNRLTLRLANGQIAEYVPDP